MTGALGAFRSRWVDVAVNTRPTGAMVSLDGIAQGVTPLRLRVPDPPRGTLKLEFPGHLSGQVELRPGDRNLEVELRPLPAPVDAQPMLAASPTERLAAPPKAPAAPAPRPRPAAAARTGKDIFDPLRTGG